MNWWYSLYNQQEQFMTENWADFGFKSKLCQMPFSQPVFFMAMLLIWTATCWVDLRESFEYIVLFMRLPKPASTETWARVDEFDDGSTVMIKASNVTKAAVATLVFLPKVGIALCM